MPRWDGVHTVFPRDHAQCCLPVCWKHLPFSIEPRISPAVPDACVQSCALYRALGVHMHPHGPRGSFSGFVCICIGSQLCERVREQRFPSGECASDKLHRLRKQREKRAPLSVPKVVVWQVNGLGFAELWVSFWLSAAIAVSSLRPLSSTRKEKHETVKEFIDGYWRVSRRVEDLCDFLTPSDLPIRPVPLEGETVKPAHPNSDICSKRALYLL